MNCVVCDLVYSTQNNPKIIVHEYLLIKDKNHNEKYYWYYKYRKKQNCNRRAAMILENEEHVLVKFTKHNYVSEASWIDVIIILNTIKEIAAS